MYWPYDVISLIGANVQGRQGPMPEKLSWLGIKQGGGVRQMTGSVGVQATSVLGRSIRAQRCFQRVSMSQHATMKTVFAIVDPKP